MNRGSSVHTRLRRLAERLGAFCPVCHARDMDQYFYRYDGRLRDHHGVPVDESVLTPCPACGRGSRGGFKVIVGVDPGDL